MIIPAMRGRDVWGSGFYGASRGNRRHTGVDFVGADGDEVRAFVAGKVTKLGYAYADDLAYRYVEVQAENGLKHRYFYVDLIVDVGDRITAGAVLGHVRSLQTRYPGITDHYHFEVFEVGDRGREYRDPIPYLGAL